MIRFPSPYSSTYMFAKALNAAVSFGKHAPPNPLLLSNPGTVVCECVIRGSDPIALTTVL